MSGNKYLIEYLEKKILLKDQKYKRHVENNSHQFFMREKQLWHKQQSTRKRKTFQEEIFQLVVPKSERGDIRQGFHTLGHTGFDKTYMAI